MVNKIRISLSKREIEHLLDNLPEVQTNSERTMIHNLLRLKLQQAGIKLMFGKGEENE